MYVWDIYASIGIRCTLHWWDTHLLVQYAYMRCWQAWIHAPYVWESIGAPIGCVYQWHSSYASVDKGGCWNNIMGALITLGYMSWWRHYSWNMNNISASWICMHWGSTTYWDPFHCMNYWRRCHSLYCAYTSSLCYLDTQWPIAFGCISTHFLVLKI